MNSTTVKWPIYRNREWKKSFIVQRSNLFEFATWKTTTNVALLACVCAGTIARLSPDFTRNKCTTCANTPDGIGEQKWKNRCQPNQPLCLTISEFRILVFNNFHVSCISHANAVLYCAVLCWMLCSLLHGPHPLHRCTITSIEYNISE